MSPYTIAAERSISVAVVDDDAAVRTSLCRMCRAFGLHANGFGSGRVFLESLDTGRIVPDCLLLDTQMPEMTGPEVQRQLALRNACLPTIVITADDGPDSRARYAAAQVLEFLRKPIGADELLLAIERVVGAPWLS